VRRYLRDESEDEGEVVDSQIDEHKMHLLGQYESAAMLNQIQDTVLNLNPGLAVDQRK
jgi:hypothetical protein